MRRPLAIATLLLALFLASLMVASVGLLMTADYDVAAELGHGSVQEGIDRLTVGNLHDLFFSKALWRSYGTCLATCFWYPGAILDWKGFLLVAALVSGTLYWGRVRAKRSWLGIAWASFGTGLVPYGLGAIVLARNTIPVVAGPWLATMALGLLYACLACALFAILDFWKPATREALRGKESCKHDLRPPPEHLAQDDDGTSLSELARA